MSGGNDKYNRELILPFSPYVQIAAGTTAGYSIGWITKKLTKTVLVLAGATLIVLPLAEKSGYLDINPPIWKKVEKDYKKLSKDFNNSFNKKKSTIDLNTVKAAAKLNPNF